MSSLHPAVSRLFALLLLVSVVGAAHRFVALPVFDAYSKLDEAIMTQSELLQRYRALGLSKSMLEARLKALKTSDAADAGWLPGDSEALVGAELQNRLKKIVEGHGGNLGSVQILPVKEEDGFRKITVRARITGTNEGIRDILYQIESQPPMLLVESLDLRGQRGRIRKANPEPMPSQLSLGVDISGFIRGGR